MLLIKSTSFICHKILKSHEKAYFPLPEWNNVGAGESMNVYVLKQNYRNRYRYIRKSKKGGGFGIKYKEQHNAH